MRSMPFAKYEGLGNDFIVVDAGVSDEAAFTEERVRALCDRRFGIGGDGVLLILPPQTSSAAGRMKVLNADGSIPEMCGNGLRCAALHLLKGKPGEIVVDTDDGAKRCTLDAAPSSMRVTIDMGEVKWLEDISIDVSGQPISFALATAGNPHAITFLPFDRDEIARVGPFVATHSRFAKGTNVEFASLRSSGRDVDLVVWERGVGLTLACGTGACATVATLVAKKQIAEGERVNVHLPGGVLEVTMKDGRAIMTGPARLVFKGALDA